jgi:hypothetical protein
MGFLTGLATAQDFAPSAALYRTSDLQIKYMPFAASVLVALLWPLCFTRAGAAHIRRCEGIAVWFDYWVSSRASTQFNLVTMNMDTNRTRNHNKYRYRLLAGLVIGLVYKPTAPLGIAPVKIRRQSAVDNS